MPITQRYQDQSTLEQLQKKYACLMQAEKYQGRIPVVISIDDDIAPDVKLRSLQYMMLPHQTLHHLYGSIRAKYKLNEAEAIFIWFNNRIEPLTKTIEQLLHDHRHPSGFLFGDLVKEQTFG
jgi:hypothetical protein